VANNARAGVSVALAACLWLSSIAAARQAPVLAPEDLDTAMKRARTAMSAASKAVGSRAFAEAGKQLGVVKQVMVDTQEFWVSRNREDAVKANCDSIARIVEVEQALVATPAPTSDVGVTRLRSIEARGI
jgi:hypothetical protein